MATIGAFDGVHLGHQTLLNSLMARGKELGLPSVVVCFEPLPREYFAPVEAPARLMSFREKLTEFRRLGIDRVLRIRFTDELRAMGAQEFIRQVFVEGLGVKHIVVGDDLRFGADREGDAPLLAEEGRQHGYEVEDTTSVIVAGERVSSSRIRHALEQADFELAEQLLGRPYSMTGKVVFGRQLGRTIDVPTANLEMHRFKAPMSGVYAVEVNGLNGTLQGVANVGLRPTVGDLTKAILEVHILDFNQDIYGRRIDVVFRHKIREEKKFNSISELKERIEADIVAGRKWFKL